MRWKRQNLINFREPTEFVLTSVCNRSCRPKFPNFRAPDQTPKNVPAVQVYNTNSLYRSQPICGLEYGLHESYCWFLVKKQYIDQNNGNVERKQDVVTARLQRKLLYESGSRCSRARCRRVPRHLGKYIACCDLGRRACFR
jgi:hypothetical protein